MKSDYALLVIDMQLCGFDGVITPPIENGTQLLDKVVDLITISRSNKIPIIFIQTCAVSGQPYAKDMHGWEIHPSISPKPEDLIVYKRNSSAFDDTNLQELLVEIGVGGVITCGIWSEFCVTNTSMSALKLGFDVYVAADAHGTVSNMESEASDIISEQNDYLKRNQAQVLDIQALRERLAES
jgi:nicotinamidase-related amidase